MKLDACILGLLLAGQSLTPAAAQGMAWTWVDSEGVTHFSDVPPAEVTRAGGDITSMDIPTGFTNADPEQDYYSITNQWKRTQQARAEQDKLDLQREQMRIEWYRAGEAARMAEAESRSRNADPPVIYVNQGYSVPWLKHGPNRYPGIWQGQYHRPGHEGPGKPGFDRPRQVQHGVGLAGLNKPVAKSQTNHQGLGPLE